MYPNHDRDYYSCYCLLDIMKLGGGSIVEGSYAKALPSNQCGSKKQKYNQINLQKKLKFTKHMYLMILYIRIYSNN